MTLGLLIPLVLFGIALTEIPIFLMLRQRVVVSAKAFPMLILASAALPLIAYLILNFALPDIGAQVVEF